ncbi:MAG TPA: hypothetical protein VFV50_12140 [Bdellovibrionales bacterium]|nr:hypothetical protein [Bdellovibrionales bacterium]
MIGEMGSTPSQMRDEGRAAAPNASAREAASVMRWATASLFFGWGLIYYFWEVPIRSFFWNEQLLKPVIETLSSVTWSEYVTSSEVNHALDVLMDLTGVFLVICALACLCFPRRFEAAGRLFLAGAGVLVVTMLTLWMDSGFQAAMFFEHAGQMLMPVIFYLYVFKGRDDETLLMLTKVGVALTFTCHGLYALGVYPVPGAFIDMIISTIGVGESTARVLLTLAGVADVLLSLMIFVPAVRTPALAYAVVWGLLTTLARPLANADLGSGLEGFFYWIAQALYRAPHFALPLILLILYKSRVQESEVAPSAPLERATLN